MDDFFNFFLFVTVLLLVGIRVYVSIVIQKKLIESKRRYWINFIYFFPFIGSIFYFFQKEVMKKRFIIYFLVAICGVYVIYLLTRETISNFNRISQSQMFEPGEKLRSDSIKVYDIKADKDLLMKFEGIQVVNFWASWCRPCITEIPELQKLKEAYPSVHVSLISFDSLNKLRETIQSRNIKLPAYFIRDTSVFEIPKLLPRTIILNNNRVVRDMYAARDWMSFEMRQIIDSLVKL